MKNSKVAPQKFLYLSSFSIFLTMLTLMFGTPFMRTLNRTYGAVAYWMLGVATSLVFWQLKAYLLLVFVASLWVSLGIQMIGEQRGYRWWVSGFLGLFFGAALGFFGSYEILVSYGLANQEGMIGLIEDFLSSSQIAQMPIKVNAKELLHIVPGLFVVTLEFAMGMGLIFERKVFRWLDLPRERFVSQANLLESRLPDAMIWFTIVAMLLAFVDLDSAPMSMVGINLIYVITVLYFFQGLAILEVFLKAIKAGFFGRFVVYFLMVGQLLPVVALFGFVDFWIDFRRKIRIAVMKSKNTEQ